MKQKKSEIRLEQGKIWIVENVNCFSPLAFFPNSLISLEKFNGNKELKLDKVESTQAVRLFNLTDCLVRIEGKFNTLSIGNCNKVGVVFSKVIGSVEINRSSKLQLEYTDVGTKLYQIDQSEGFNL